MPGDGVEAHRGAKSAESLDGTADLEVAEVRRIHQEQGPGLRGPQENVGGSRNQGHASAIQIQVAAAETRFFVWRNPVCVIQGGGSQPANAHAVIMPARSRIDTPVVVGRVNS